MRGQRVRRNFDSEGAAEAERSKILSGMIRDAPPAPVATRLTVEQVRAAELAYQDLPNGTTLREAVAFFRAHQQPREQHTFAAASARWSEWLRSERKAKEETAKYQASVITHFARDARLKYIGEATSEDCRRWIFQPALVARSQRDRFDLLAYFFRWAVKHQLCALHPMERLDRPVWKNRVAPLVLTVEETSRLLREALTDAEGPDMLPYFAICVLSGVRPEEAPDLAWDDVWLADEHQLIEVNRTKGGRRRRNSEVCPALARILSWAKARALPLGFHSRRKFRRIRRNAGLEARWCKDILRHTYASHHYALHHDIKRLTSAMGNSEDVLFQHYVRPVLRAEAEKFFALDLDYAAPRRASAMGTGPKPRKKKTAAPGKGSGG